MPDSLSATTTTTTTNAPLGGSIAFFPPFLTTTPLPLLLQNPASSLHRPAYTSRVLSCCARKCATLMMLNIGFTPLALGSTLPSITYNPRAS